MYDEINKKLLLIEAKVKEMYLAMHLIGYRKANGMMPQTQIVEMLQMVKFVDNVKSFLCESMDGWKMVLTSISKVSGKI